VGVDVDLDELDGTVRDEFADDRVRRHERRSADQDPVLRPGIISGNSSKPVGNRSTISSNSRAWKSPRDGSPREPRSGGS
jgi:hypothetical protein